MRTVTSASALYSLIFSQTHQESKAREVVLERERPVPLSTHRLIRRRVTLFLSSKLSLEMVVILERKPGIQMHKGGRRQAERMEKQRKQLLLNQLFYNCSLSITYILKFPLFRKQIYLLFGPLLLLYTNSSCSCPLT